MLDKDLLQITGFFHISHTILLSLLLLGIVSLVMCYVKSFYNTILIFIGFPFYIIILTVFFTFTTNIVFITSIFIFSIKIFIFIVVCSKSTFVPNSAFSFFNVIIFLFLLFHVFIFIYTILVIIFMKENTTEKLSIVFSLLSTSSSSF
ncbi:hypothetical protein ALC57_16291 [Trachymyrmex cornetzi]|uniref:Uncharacterized protein n=1 Tax=Trachymyrmex cornetzi TaxID=471704 RepID=A0A195DF32_9HYME|nr:hypothetical protein ALC57_16291 [Trachymyrmex cornetzi]